MKKSIEQSILSELVGILYRNLSFGLVAVLIIGIFLFCLLLGSIKTSYLVLWFLLFSLNALGGFVTLRRYKRTCNDKKMIIYHYYEYIIGSSISAILLGVLGSVLMPLDMPHQALVMIAIISISGAAVQNSHASYLASGCFLGFSLIPLLMWQFLQIIKGEYVFIGIFIVTLNYFIYLAIDVKTGYATLNNNIRLKLENIYLSIHDELTGLYNRHFLKVVLHQVVEKFERNKSLPICFVLFDLDHFKKINDAFGHDEGDDVLCRISKLTKKFFRKTDYIFRYGGEEFLIVFEGISCSLVAERMERFRKQVNSLSEELTPQKKYSISISVGISSFPEHGDSPDVLIKAADKALYGAKSKGRNQIGIAQ